MKYMFYKAALLAALLGGMSTVASAIPIYRPPVVRGPGRCPDLIRMREFQAGLQCYLYDPSSVAIATHISYRFGNQELNYKQWSPEARQQLGQAFERTILWYESGMNNYPGTLVQDPAPNLEAAAFAAGTHSQTVYDEATVLWPLYVGRVALILAAEINVWVPWSIKEYETMPNPGALLSYLFRTGHGIKAYTAANGQSITLGTGYMDGITPTNSITIFKFLKQKNLIGATRKQTIERILDWSRWNQAHTAGALGGPHMYHYFQYWGAPPMSRMLDGTYATDPELPTEYKTNKYNWTHGCYGTSDFLARLLKAANITANTQLVGPHRTVSFLSEGLYLSHADDPYNSLFKYNRPIASLFIDEAKFQAWFPANDPVKADSNVGRQVMEINLQYPSPSLVNMYQLDIWHGKSRADGTVYAMYKNWYTVAQLEAMGFYSKLDAALGY